MDTNPLVDRAKACADEYGDLYEAAAHADNLPASDSPAARLIELGNQLATHVRQLAVRAQAWERMDGALLANADGSDSAADVCAAGFALQEQLANPDRRTV